MSATDTPLLVPATSTVASSGSAAPAAAAAAAVKKDWRFFFKAALCGGLAAMATHALMVPVDVVKTKLQLPNAPANARLAVSQILRTDGVRGLSLGLGPTFFGYYGQGMGKYGLYELFKVRFAAALGQETAEKNATAVYLAASITAEVFADFLLTPFEAVRIRMVAGGDCGGGGTFRAMHHIYTTEGLGTLYKGLLPLLGKQVPYTAVKLTVFEHVEHYLYEDVITTPREQLHKAKQLAVTTVSGFVGGVASAIASHPADTVLTKVNVSQRGMLSLMQEMGFLGLFAGIVPRMGMVGVLSALQLLAYDSAKVMIFGLPTSQGIRKH